MALLSDDYFELESCICGQHIHKDVWTPVVNEEFSCRREDEIEIFLIYMLWPLSNLASL